MELKPPIEQSNMYQDSGCQLNLLAQPHVFRDYLDLNSSQKYPTFCLLESNKSFNVHLKQSYIRIFDFKKWNPMEETTEKAAMRGRNDGLPVPGL